MSRELIRRDIVTAVEAIRANLVLPYPLVVEYDNVAVVDTKTQFDPFITVEIKYLSAEQADLGNNPLRRQWGQINLAAVVPEGSGTAKANQLLDWFIPRLGLRAFGSVRTHVVTDAPAKMHLGWVYYFVAVPFWADYPNS